MYDIPVKLGHVEVMLWDLEALKDERLGCLIHNIPRVRRAWTL